MKTKEEILKECKVNYVPDWAGGSDMYIEEQDVINAMDKYASQQSKKAAREAVLKLWSDSEGTNNFNIYNWLIENGLNKE